METDPKLTIEFDGEKHEFDRDHASIYMFAGELACYDHIFLVELNENGDDYDGWYVWSSHSAYEDLVEFMDACEFPTHINQWDVSPRDEHAFALAHYQDTIGENITFPEEWTNSTDPS